MENLDLLLDKAKWEGLSDKELEEVAQRLENYKKETHIDVHYLLNIIGGNIREGFIGRGTRVKYRSLVEKFLVFPDEPMISSLALKILCDYWCFTEDYLSNIQQFLDGVSWDTDNDVRLTAISIAGEYLSENRNVELLKALMKIFSDPELNEVIRSEAYYSIMGAVKAPRKWTQELAVEEFAMNLDKYIDQSVIDKANEIIKAKSSGILDIK